MDPNERKIDILHVEGCRCHLDGPTIYVAAPCAVIGHHVTKRRLGQLVHMFRRQVDEVMAASTNEETLKFKSVRVQAGQHVLCVARPQHPPFLWQRFEITDPDLWTILNVAIGNCSLFDQNPNGGAGISARRLNEDGLLCKDVCHYMQDFSICAVYIGKDPEGAEFICDVLGRVP